MINPSTPIFKSFHQSVCLIGVASISFLLANLNRVILFCFYLSRTMSHTTKYIHQRDSPLVRLLGGEGTIPKSTQYVTVMTDTTQ